ncbi:glycoside hydrolase family 35 protein [Infundibulicybe gibba]|nr:glycoside hydrolase family 35 protein [Infundibulicybe gibba]
MDDWPRKREYRLGRQSRWFWLTTCIVTSLFVLGTAKLSPAPLLTSFNPNIDPRAEPLPNTDATSTPFQQLARSDQVRFDNYSLFLNGQRIFLYSGEFHTFRLPVPSLWPDILEKVKASGLNAVSVYTHMGLINPSRGVVDFNDFRALQPLYDAAKAAGIWVVLRPGPYINAETSAGGIAHWATAEVAGALRTNATDWKAAWQPYIQGIIDQTTPNQITNGGPVIVALKPTPDLQDNEFSQSPISQAEYFVDLENAYHASEIVVPLTYNDPGEGRNFINGTGAVDLYGLDSYPQGFDCSNPTTWRAVDTSYHSYHASANPSQAWYFPEFQGGSFDAWGPNAPGYPPCRVLTGPDFQSVFNRQLWASNAKLINYYMLYGGTSWGAIPFPGVYTSYDYGASITESRELTTKFDELKRQGIFLRSSPEFYKTNWIADTSTGLAISSSSAAFITFLQNPDTKAGFYVARQTASTSTTTITFKLNVTTSSGNIQIPVVAPAITLGGRQSKVIVTNYAFGSSRLVYSTAQVFFAGTIDGRDVLFLYGDSSQAHETDLPLTGTPSPVAQSSSVKLTAGPSAGTTIVSFSPGIAGLVTVWDSDKQLVLFADSVTAATFWSPVIAGGATDPLRNYWGLGSNTSILVGGPYLVRTATISGSSLALRGDLNTSAQLTVIAPRSIRTVTWNGDSVSSNAAASTALTHIGGFVGTLNKAPAAQAITVPTLGGWKFKDSLPEITSGFSDASWTVANHTTTNVPSKPLYGDGRVLYGCDYGFCENIVLWRGHFVATGTEKTVNISINGGEAFAASIWANNIFLGTSFGNSTNNKNNIQQTDQKFTFPAGSLKAGSDNVITIVQDNMGLDEGSGRSARGVRGFKLDTGNFGAWKVQGKVGGYTGYANLCTGVFNEGGLFGERMGWHLPGFDTSSWVARDLATGLPGSAAGVGFFVTTFNLNITEGFDVPMSFTFGEPLGQPYRAILFVNGWMMGKRVGNLGPQAKFPVHEGILDYRGKNTVAVALWAMTPNTPITPNLQLVVDGVFEGGVGGVVTNNPPWSATGRQ